MTGERTDIALRAPATDLTTFPSCEVAGHWHRAHTATREPWWFSHDGSGRFDLSTPAGTCYLAADVQSAVLERLGPTLAAAAMISGTQADAMVVSTLTLGPTRAADGTDTRAATAFGITREIGTVTPYGRAQEWSHALHRAGFEALRYWPRFSLGADQTALALFGAAGADDTRPLDAAPMTGRSAARRAGIDVLDPPRSVTTVTPGR
ncbi:RES domain-containing protein [Nocardioides sp.]|uniref:RES domain-containing protein n=1 Tax=Nocardioides sp. TaxID=35761 RepID=UPI002630B770|nr:RES domain-containing protein [Nocardioides sp.]